MTEDNKLRLKQLGWGNKFNRPTVASTRRRTAQDIHILKLEKELNDVLKWMERLSDRYRERGYDATAIDKRVARIKRALKP